MNFRFWKKKPVEKRSEDFTYVNPYGMGGGIVGGKSDISLYKATSLSAIFSATQLISNSIAELPLTVNTHEEGKTTRVKEHPVYHVFDNTILSKFVCIKNAVSDCLLYGNGYIYITRAEDGITPLKLTYCPYNDVIVEYNQSRSYETLYYRNDKVARGRIERCDMIHLTFKSDDGINGKGIIFWASRAIKLANYTESASLDFFGNGLNIAGVLTTDAPRLTADQVTQIKNAWQTSIGSTGRGVAVLEGGMNYQAVSSNAKDAQMLESRLFNIQEIARFFNISPTLLGDLTHSSYNSLEQSMQQFVTVTLMPLVTQIQEELTRKLLKPSEINSGLYIDLDEAYLVKSDKNSQANYLKTLVSGGIMTINESRAVLGLNPVDGGDELIIPYTDVNMNTVGNVEE